MSLDAEEPGHETTSETAWQQAGVGLLEPQQHTVQGRFGNTTQQAGHGATKCNLLHALVAFFDGENQHTGDHAEAGKVPGAHGALDDVFPIGGDVLNHDGVERPVQTQRHQERVDQRDDDGQDEGAEIIDRGKRCGDTITHADTERAEQERGERDHDEQGEERDEHHVHGRRNDLLQALFHPEQPNGGNEWWEHLTGIGVNHQRQPHHVHGIPLATHGEEFRGEEGRGDGGTHPLVRPKFPSGAGTHHDRQEVEHRLVGGVQQLEHRRLGLNIILERLNSEGVKQHQEGNHQRGTEQCPQDGAERVGQKFESIVDESVFATHPAIFFLVASGSSLGIIVAHARQGFNTLVVFGNVTTHHNLQPGGTLRDHPQHGRVIVKRILVGLRLVRQLEPQARCTVG